MDILSALRTKAEQAEVYAIESEATAVSFEANEMKAAKVEETQGIALRAVVEGRLGFTAASGRVVEDELVENVLASAQYGDRVPVAFPGKASALKVDVYDAGLAGVPIARLADIGREVIAALRAVDEDAHVSVDLERSVGRSSLRNSEGAEIEDRRSSFSVGISVERVRGDDVLMVYDSVNEISFTDSYQQAVERMASKVESAKRAARLASGRMPVLFAPTGAMLLGLPMMLATNGQNVQRGVSPLSDKLGEKVFDAQLTLWDDPTLPGRPSSASYDDEGVPCRRKSLISQGVCQGFVFDLKSAALMGGESTGNGARSLFSPPSPSATNLVLESGSVPLAEILAGIRHGLLVEHVLGLGQGNAMSGAFSNTVGLAYVIEGGEIVGRVKDVSIAGNIYEDLREVAAISQEAHWVYGRLKMPYILLPELNVVCKA